MTITRTMRTGVAVLSLVAAGFSSGAVLADHHGKTLKMAVENTARPEADRQRDTMRKPLRVLNFAGIAPGMTVLDINSAGGYYTEILSRAVGDDGKVYAHNGPVYWAFMKETVPARFDGGRLTNVTHLHNGKETFDLPEASVDVAMAVLAYHDYYFTHDARPGGGHEDVPAVLASLYRVIKPGGAVVIVDHVAREGTGPADFDKLHRIDPAVVQAQMEAAGFKLADQAEFLKNQEDNLVMSPFDPSIRGKTNRFVYRFEKP